MLNEDKYVLIGLYFITKLFFYFRLEIDLWYFLENYYERRKTTIQTVV